MKIVTQLLTAFVALEHIGFLVLEMFLWRSPAGMKIFRTTAEFAEQSAPLAANQGLYNGFLAAGLLWALLDSRPDEARRLQFFFLGCVLVAGIFGGLTSKRSILVVQALPAAFALAALWLITP